MATDLTLSVLISRGLLGLADLDIAAVPYYVSPQFLGGQSSWNRTKINSPFTDGEITVQRSRQNVTENVGVEIVAANAVDLQTSTTALITAFMQNYFTMTVTVNGATNAYGCEAADYQVMSWSTPRMVAFQGQVLFQVPRQPLALAGGY